MKDRYSCTNILALRFTLRQLTMGVRICSVTLIQFRFRNFFLLPEHCHFNAGPLNAPISNVPQERKNNLDLVTAFRRLIFLYSAVTEID
jgi:hypothetical protein